MNDRKLAVGFAALAAFILWLFAGWPWALVLGAGILVGAVLWQ